MEWLVFVRQWKANKKNEVQEILWRLILAVLYIGQRKVLTLQRLEEEKEPGYIMVNAPNAYRSLGSSNLHLTGIVTLVCKKSNLIEIVGILLFWGEGDIRRGRGWGHSVRMMLSFFEFSDYHEEL